jgi:ferredoxin
MSTTICYFTGTGNSYYVANACARAFAEPRILSLREVRQNPQILEGTTVLGLVFPVYFMAPPALMAEFIIKTLAELALPLEYLFVIATNGGLVGFSMMITERLLAQAGYVPSYAESVRMVDTYIPWYKIPEEAEQKALYSKADFKLASIVTELSEQKLKVPPRRVLARMYQSIWKQRIPHRASLDTRFCVSESCTGCGLCARICPAGNITMVDGKPSYAHACEQCFGCYHRCPTHAISLTHRPLQGYTWFPNIRSGHNQTKGF